MPETFRTTPARTPVRHGAWVLLLLSLGTLGAFGLDHQVSLTSQAMLYVLVVVIGAYTLPLLDSVALALGAVAAFNFFFVPPRWTFAVDNQEHLIALVTMLVVALTISHLTARLRNESTHAARNEVRARQLQTLATAMTSATTPQAAHLLGQKALDTAFEGPCLMAVLQDNGHLVLPPGTDTNVRDGMVCCMRERATLGPGTGRWPGLNAWYLPLNVDDQAQGAACIENVLAADHAGREHAQALCALISQSLWRLRLAEEKADADARAARQQVESTFLAAISHDLRTPLAVLVGAASALQTQRDKLSVIEIQRLIDTMASEARYLSDLTENTLQLVQLTNAAQPVQHDWESLEEIVGTVLPRLRARYPHRRVQLRLPADTPLVHANAVLLGQLVDNLLDNALKYSTGAVDLVAQTVHGAVELAVKDRGPDIDPARYEAIFQPYARDDQSGQRGAGLGLALCRAIAQAHNGTLTLRRRQGGGNCFTLRMPATPTPAVGALPCL